MSKEHETKTGYVLRRHYGARGIAISEQQYTRATKEFYWVGDRRRKKDSAYEWFCETHEEAIRKGIELLELWISARRREAERLNALADTYESDLDILRSALVKIQDKQVKD